MFFFAHSYLIAPWHTPSCVITSAPFISAYPGPYPPMTRAAREERDCTTKGVERERHTDGKRTSSNDVTGGKYISVLFSMQSFSLVPHSTLESKSGPSCCVDSPRVHSLHSSTLHSDEMCFHSLVAVRREKRASRNVATSPYMGAPAFSREFRRKKPCLCQTSPPMYRVFPQPPPPPPTTNFLIIVTRTFLPFLPLPLPLFLFLVNLNLKAEAGEGKKVV